MSYLYEMHCHTSEVSGCGRVEAIEAVKLLKQQNYSGVVITDHLTPDGLKNVSVADWKNFIDHFLIGYKLAKQAESADFKVLLGAEIRFPENDNDYLLYGLTEEFLYSHAYINRLSLREFREIADKNNILIMQAHPMRNSMTVMNPDYLDGYEVYNGNKRHNSRNEVANAWAELNGKIKVSGSDFHQLEDLARGGLFFANPIESTQHLVNMLLQGSYKIKST